MSDDPYFPPESNPSLITGEESSGKNDTVPPLVAEHMRGTRSWVKFCSLAGYVGAGFLFVIALFCLRSLIWDTPHYRTILVGMFHLILAILFFIPSRYLSRYEKSISHLMVSRRLSDLEQALADQRAFWRQMAIMILILLVIYLITIVFSAMVVLSRGS